MYDDAKSVFSAEAAQQQKLISRSPSFRRGVSFSETPGDAFSSRGRRNARRLPSDRPIGMASTFARRTQNNIRGWLGYPPILLPEEQSDRYIYANNATANRAFCDNIVVT